MPNCYVCGTYLEPARHQLRRKVRTGERLRRSYLRDRFRPASLNVNFGFRVVCRRCAKRIDRERFLAELPQLIEFGAAVAFLLGLAAWRIFGR